MGAEALEQRLREFAARGVEIVDPRQTFIDADVIPDRVRPGATLHPGTRLHGARTFLAEGVEIGTEGPATVRDAVFGPGASIASGYVDSAVLFAGASLGAAAHVRPGTILEEQASSAHCVGLKHTILLSFVTLGSLINFCDCLMSGGTSRKDHSEVGSGFIHFNFTPWGERGDKATPSLIGDVLRGVFLREPKIFLGGSAGLVGPGRVGFGAITGAGQVVRKTVEAGHLSLQPIRALDVVREPGHLDRTQPRAERNVAYLQNLVALRAWYREVRLARAKDAERVVVLAGIETLEVCIAERMKRLKAFLAERGEEMPQLELEPEAPHPFAREILRGPELDHISWVQQLTDAERDRGVAWLQSVADSVAG